MNVRCGVEIEIIDDNNGVFGGFDDEVALELRRVEWPGCEIPHNCDGCREVLGI